jgi:hypothetical protein
MLQSLPFFIARVTTRKVTPAVEESLSGEKVDGLLLPERVNCTVDAVVSGR